MNTLRLILLSYVLLWNGVSCAPLLTIVRDLLQWNVAGIPVIHEKSTWNFHPDEGTRKQIAYEATNGKLGNQAIARLGLGFES